MAEQTPKLGLSLPAADDFYDVNVTNANFAAIDAHAAAMGDKNAPNGYAGLDEDGKLPETIAPPMIAENILLEPVDGLTATDVQEVVDQLQAGKAAKSHTHTAAALSAAPPAGQGWDTVQKYLDGVKARADEAFTSASNGRATVAGAINAKGVPATAADTFPVLAGKIGQIETGTSEYSFSYDGSLIAPYWAEGNVPGTQWIPAIDREVAETDYRDSYEPYLFHVGDYLISISGYYIPPPTSPAPRCYMYSFSAANWTTVRSIQGFQDAGVSMNSVCMGEHGGFVYKLGGRPSFSDDPGADNIKRFDVLVGTVSTVKTSVYWRATNCKGVVIGSTMYFQCNRGGTTSLGLAYDIVTNTISTLPEAVSGSVYMAEYSRQSAAHNSMLYSLVGTSGSSYMLAEYNPATNTTRVIQNGNTWFQMSSGIPRSTMLVARNNILYAFVGHDVTNNTWSAAHSLPTGTLLAAPPALLEGGFKNCVVANGSRCYCVFQTATFRVFKIVVWELERGYTLLGAIKAGTPVSMVASANIPIIGYGWFSPPGTWHALPAIDGYLAAPIGTPVTGMVRKR